MNTKNSFTKTLLATSIATIFSLGAVSAYAQQNQTPETLYTDPQTGEVKVAAKFLSEMTEEEKAALSIEEIKILAEIEAQSKVSPEYPKH